ncbi:P-loop containing nucleoside triphosphate hydrolase protein [Tilletiaria anomala UBC 951]|uniref:Replication factor C subunit 5 n=1 Tax=Tilletiaria anomala (strain ATCC 24038 / CBS 436.72 / UBC 951) TaxID=1037660 RepID=A0A066VLH6_TILAU|nr:P-loop containing nucleoside triphosphate hydrolase protein [Tilletiaria anomala UBC 951]KDN42602.1 P-loop containing nucleoside triphosphate hydrolase protein [Tilletiaria anomala UBC 951]
MLFVDKYRPKQMSELHYHEQLSQRLTSLAAHEDFPHMLFYGPSGAGKKTRIMCLLRELYGSGTQKLKIDQRVFLNPSKRKIDVNIVSSNYHIELTPSDAGGYDRLVIQDILKEIAQTQQVDQAAKHRFKVVIINEADALSRDAQSALRRTMEKYMSNLRLILCANSTSKIIAPIRSRCLLMRVAAPTQVEMAAVLRFVAKKEKFHLPDDVAGAIYADAKGNLRKAILILEALRMQSLDLSGLLDIAKPDWETYTHQTAEMILKQQTPEQLLAVRGKLYELLVHAIPSTLILKTLVNHLVTRVDASLQPQIIDKAAFYQLRLRQGNKAILHLEAFVAQVMAMQKQLVMGF